LELGAGLGKLTFVEVMGTNRRTIAGQTSAGRKRSQRLGDTLSELMEKQIAPRRARFELVAEAWEQLLPAELQQHCRIANIQGGRLKVVADSPAHQFELRLCSSEFVKELAVRCPQAKIEKIEIVVG
jgi:predicted nucleic acid-binding Zn ribbon protein